jgi:hypothetical protein
VPGPPPPWQVRPLVYGSVTPHALADEFTAVRLLGDADGDGAQSAVSQVRMVAIRVPIVAIRVRMVAIRVRIVAIRGLLCGPYGRL